MPMRGVNVDPRLRAAPCQLKSRAISRSVDSVAVSVSGRRHPGNAWSVAP